MQGLTVRVQTMDGFWYEGIFHGSNTGTVEEDGGVSVALKKARLLESTSMQPKDPFTVIATLVIAAADLAQVVAVDVDMTYPVGGQRASDNSQKGIIYVQLHVMSNVIL